MKIVCKGGRHEDKTRHYREATDWVKNRRLRAGREENWVEKNEN